MKIGFVGLGHMGLPMVKNLLVAHHQVSAFDLSEAAIAAAVEAGATAAGSYQQVADSADVIISMLPTPAIVSSAYTSTDGLLAHTSPHALLIDCSTGDPQTAVRLGQLAAEQGKRMIDAPVSGGVGGAAAGTLTFMVGGQTQDFEAAREVLSAMGKNLVHCGAHGTGQIAKLCNNVLLGIAMVGVAESMSLGVRLGIDPAVLAGIINTSSGRCWVSDTYNPYPGVLPNAPASNGFAGGFASDLMIKDISLAIAAADGVRQPMPMSALSKQLFQMLSLQGMGGLDISAIITSFQRPQ